MNEPRLFALLSEIAESLHNIEVLLEGTRDGRGIVVTTDVQGAQYS